MHGYKDGVTALDDRSWSLRRREDGRVMSLISGDRMVIVYPRDEQYLASKGAAALYFTVEVFEGDAHLGDHYAFFHALCTLGSRPKLGFEIPKDMTHIEHLRYGIASPHDADQNDYENSFPRPEALTVSLENDRKLHVSFGSIDMEVELNTKYTNMPSFFVGGHVINVDSDGMHLHTYEIAKADDPPEITFDGDGYATTGTPRPRA